MSTAPGNNVGLGLDGSYPLWSDNPSYVDLLAFSPVAETVAAALLDDLLDPVALGVSGRWGSGKTTVLNLVESELSKLNTDESKILVVGTDPWRYDPATGIKESLISEVLSALEGELDTKPDSESKARGLFKRLSQRVDWARAISLAAKSSLLMQIPSFDELVGLVKDQDDGSGNSARGLEAFRTEFRELLESPELEHVRRVVVLVDDLDRCLPDTVIETLEGIRLFLAVPKMSFVIAADEERVAEAIRTRYNKSVSHGESPVQEIDEEPAKLYLHKIVQTTVPLPALSRFDTEAYLLLLQILPKVQEEGIAEFVEQCDLLRRESKDLTELPGVDGVDLADELLFAERLTPILYEKLRGNPRRIKRFLNDLHVRQSVATRRGITLRPEVVAKMMVLEQLLPEEFDRVLSWLARGSVRSEMRRLEEAAGQAPLEMQVSLGDNVSSALSDQNGTAVISAGESEQTFTDALIRWAKLSPPLREEDLSVYLHLAASFAGQTVLDRDLPERLRDMSASLLSPVRADQYSVTDDDLNRLPADDAKYLLQHLGRMGRDRPTDQRKAVEAILRLSRQQGSLGAEACTVLGTIPADEIMVPSLLLFKTEDIALRPALEKWRLYTTKQTTRNAIDQALGNGG